jgi:hypothetical protein
MRDRFGENMEENPDDDDLEDNQDAPPDPYMVANCERCDDTGLHLSGLYRCNHVDYSAIARRHIPAIKAQLKKAKHG